MNRTCISRWNILYFLAITLTGLPAATSIDIWGKQNARSSKNLWPPAVLSTPLRQNPPDSVLRSSTDDWNANERHGNRIESDDVTAKHKNYNNHNGEEEEHCFLCLLARICHGDESSSRSRGILLPRPDPFHSVRISFMAAIWDALNPVEESVSVSVHLYLYLVALVIFNFYRRLGSPTLLTSSQITIRSHLFSSTPHLTHSSRIYDTPQKLMLNYGKLQIQAVKKLTRISLVCAFYAQFRCKSPAKYFN